jgi:hypothetical protein
MFAVRGDETDRGVTFHLDAGCVAGAVAGMHGCYITLHVYVPLER